MPLQGPPLKWTLSAQAWWRPSAACGWEWWRLTVPSAPASWALCCDH
ncbi:hypothetical protein HaLaN_25955, partial [Haematococcus lacustris]